MTTATRLVTRPRQRPRQTSVRQRLASAGGYIIVFLIGFTGQFTVFFIGAFPIGEIILVPLLPFLIALYWRKIIKRDMIPVFGLMALWLFGQVATDIIRKTPTLDAMRGFAAITFFAIDLAGVAALLRGNDRHKVVFFIGNGLGSISFVMTQPSHDFWKFGIGYGTMMIAVIVSCYFYRRRRHMITGAIFVAIVMANLLFNYRSPILFALVVMALTLPIVPEQILRFRVLPRSGSFARIAVLAATAVVAALVAQRLVSWATAKGLAGEEAQAKNLRQEESKHGILLGGRPEILVSSRAVIESPIIGHGSWAKDAKYAEMLYDIQVENGIEQSFEDVWGTELGLIPAHSHLMGSWVWAGILGAVFWVYILVLVVKGIVVVANQHPPLAPLYGWLLVGYVWAIPFSPFGSIVRLYEAGILVILLDLLERQVPLTPRVQWSRRAQWQSFRTRGRIPLSHSPLPKSRRFGAWKTRPRFGQGF